MNTTSLLAAAALALVATAGAQAESYDGVHHGASARQRSEVAVEAAQTASAPDQNVTRGSRGAERFTSTADPAAVKAQAIATANAPDQNVSAGTKFNSRVVSTMPPRTDVQTQARQGAAVAPK